MSIVKLGFLPRVLIVVAHPDDEVLGCGGTAATLAKAGCEVRTCILSADADARTHRPDVKVLHENVRAAGRILGLSEPFFGSFPNIRMNTTPHLEAVRFIESAILELRPSIVFTHYPHDLNNDHLHTSLACQAAVRIYQRRGEAQQLKGLLFMEILSSTEWAFGVPQAFLPNAFYDVSDAWHKKLEALSCYQGVLRPHPHPRSLEAVEALGSLRGAQAGFRRAEAFQTAFIDLTP